MTPKLWNETNSCHYATAAEREVVMRNRHMASNKECKYASLWLTSDKVDAKYHEKQPWSGKKKGVHELGADCVLQDFWLDHLKQPKNIHIMTAETILNSTNEMWHTCSTTWMNEKAQQINDDNDFKHRQELKDRRTTADPGHHCCSDWWEGRLLSPGYS